MNAKPICYPPKNKDLSRGAIVSWKFRENITLSHGIYVIRFTVWFQDGSCVHKEKGGFHTKKEALAAREDIISMLNCHEYVIINVSVEDFLEYWLHYYMIDEQKIAYATYVTYRSAIRNDIVPEIGKLKLNDLSKSDILSVLEKARSPSILQRMYGVFGASFRYAKQMNLVRYNYAIPAIKTKRRMVRLKKQKLEASDPTLPPQPALKKRRSLTAGQICSLLYLCKTEIPEFYIPLLLACTTGCRISELIALRFRDIDFLRKEIHIKGQIGRPVDITDIPTGQVTKQHLQAKSAAGKRVIPIPEFTMEELVAYKCRTVKEKSLTNERIWDTYIWCRADGSSHGRRDYQEPFKRLKEKLGIPEDFHWHDLRHSYATIMENNHVNLKEMASVLGHTSGEFTLQVYVDKSTPEFPGVKKYFDFLKDSVQQAMKIETTHIEPGYSVFLTKLLQ
ncbi:MAG: site-specific integrase [Clostridiales bacterium]|nr:site-specific integrase [Clostridiales bacterium]